MKHETATNDWLETRRRAARRTALWMALVAAGIFLAFMLKGILG